MKATVLGFAGGVKSGKSTISSAVAQVLGCPRVSFGNYVRTIATQNGLPAVRETLQAVGESLVRTNVEQFCSAVLGQVVWKPGDALIIDGIRHLEVLQVLKQLVLPAQLKLLYVEVAITERRRRLIDSEKTAKSLEELEAHSTEHDVTTALKSQADVIIEGTRTMKVIVDEIVSWASKFP